MEYIFQVPFLPIMHLKNNWGNDFVNKTVGELLI